MKLKPLLEFDRRQVLAFQQALLDHEDIEDVELYRVDSPDGVTFKVTLADSDVKWYVDYWDMLDGGDQVILTLRRWGEHEHKNASGKQIRVPSEPKACAVETVTAIHGVFP